MDALYSDTDCLCEEERFVQQQITTVEVKEAGAAFVRGQDNREGKLPDN